MDKKVKSPAERGMTASTDTRVVRRLSKGPRGPAVFHVDSIVKEVVVDPNAPKVVSAGGIAPLMLMIGGLNSKGQLVNYTQTHVEFAVQQAWYAPWGDKEWHDMEFVDLVPEDKR